jgi:anti-sigma factor RsiW
MSASHPSDEQRPESDRLEEIVAYLDGELTPGESARVEQRLSSDESYRRELQEVERAWKALDELPQLSVDDKFSRTTMALTLQTAKAELQERTTALPVQRRRGKLAAGLMTAAAAALGFLVVRLAMRHPERMLLSELPVVESVDAYSQIDGIEYLRRLDQEFGPTFVELGAKADEPPAGLERLQAIVDEGAREAWLSELDAAERTNLRAKYNRFRELPPEEQERLRALHVELAQAPDGEELQRALFAYHEWLRGLPPARQFELRSAPIDQRVRRVRQLASTMRDDELFALSEEELRRFVGKMRGPFEELIRDAARDMLEERGGRWPNRRGEPMNQLPRILAAHFASEVARPGDFQTALIEALPERSREPFEQLAPREKVQRVMAWKRQAETLQGQVSESELERFFAEELDAETRAELLALPPGDMQQTLRRLYRRQVGFGPEGPGGWGRPPRDGRGGRGRGDGRPPRFGEGPDGPPPRGPFGPADMEREFGRPGERGEFGPRREPPNGERRGPRRDDDRPPP